MGRANPSVSRKKPDESGSVDSKEKARAKPGHKPLPLGSDARKNARVVFALAIVALSLWTAAGFLSALIWATILAIALWPLYVAFANRVMSGPSGWSAFAFTCFVAVILFTPMALAIYQVAQQSGEIAAWLKKARESGIEVPDWIARLPIAAEIAQQWWRANLSDPQAATGWLKAISADSASDLFNSLGGQLLHRMFMLLFSLVALFVLLSNGRSVASRFLETSERILGHPGEGVVEKIVDSIRGTVNGTVVVAVGEGLLIGVGYLVAGVPNAVMFTIFTTAFAMLPFGAWAAFSAAALTLISNGNEAAAAGVFCWGAVIMLAGDHFVWPVLVGGSARLPFLFAFVGIFGGLAAFGLIGLFLGPVVMAALLTVWREWVFRPVAATQFD
ncbi:putative PurR-regulated permease PerM [Bradyrhizobium japonicum]|uniref:AI-2E family transporter n=1 Tax=Bradyrhizobium barranii subsp. barranii TaxID=2823807 RepID=A0A7Z0QA50_9BRAD|nr:AI-2E family transporter [Bradyrhizobium liaoningense]MBR1001124.1 AI-2E family transporter [Bradyrhizobium liaoningense]